MSKRPDIDPQVISVVRSWAAAGQLDAAAAALADGRRALDATLRIQLQAEIAEISAEGLIDLIAMVEGTDEGEPQEVLGLQLMPVQRERVSAWLFDQRATAEALGLEQEVWGKLLVAGMERYIAREAGDAPAGSTRAAGVELARKLVGAEGEPFENRPELGTSDQAGLRGILGARAFQKKGR